MICGTLLFLVISRVYNTQTNAWSSIPSFNTPLKRRSHICAVVNTTMYVLLGATDDTNVDPVLNDIYSLQLNNINSWTSVSWVQAQSIVIPTGGGRFNIEGGEFLNYIVFFGGRSNNTAVNDCWRVEIVQHVETIAIQQTHPVMLSPNPLAGHSLAAVGNILYIFGGRSVERGVLYNQMYSYNTDTEVWSPLPPQTSPPSERQHAAMISMGELLLLHGGVASNGDALGDLWIFSTILGQWRKIEPRTASSSEIPAPRYMHTMRFNGTHAIMFGGRTRSQMIQDIYVLNVNTQVWTMLQTSNMPDKSISCDSVVAYNQFILSGCSDLPGVPSRHMYSLDLLSLSWTVVLRYPDEAQSTEHALFLLKNDTFMIFGGNSNSRLNNQLFKLTSAVTTVVNPVFNTLPNHRTEHEAVLYGDRIILYGGAGSITSGRIKVTGRIYSDLWEFKLLPCSKYFPNETDCILCSIGTFEYRGVCLSCPTGSYNDIRGATSCKLCAPGFFNSIEGAQSIDACLPCPYGYYSNIYGASECVKCTLSQDCPIGSVSQLNSSATPVRTILFKSQPHLLANKDDLEAFLQFGIFGSIALVVSILIAVIFVLLQLRWINYKIFILVDVFYAEKHNKKRGIMRKKKNIVGAVFTIIAFCATAAYLVFSILAFMLNNQKEVRTLIPNLSVDPNVQIQANLFVTVKFLGYPGNCIRSGYSCAENLSFKTNFLFSNSTITCNAERDEQVQASNCTVSIKLESCMLPFGMDQTSIEIVDSEDYAAGFEYSAEATTGYWNQSSQISGYLGANKNSFFKGAQVPTSVNFLLIQSTHLITKSNDQFTGFHIDFLSSALGSQVDYTEFTFKKGVSFVMNFVKTQYTLDIQLSEKRSWLKMIAETLGSMTGIVAAVGVVMGFIESIVYQLNKYTRLAPKIRKLLTKSLVTSKPIDEMQVKLIHADDREMLDLETINKQN